MEEWAVSSQKVTPTVIWLDPFETCRRTEVSCWGKGWLYCPACEYSPLLGTGLGEDCQRPKRHPSTFDSKTQSQRNPHHKTTKIGTKGLWCPAAQRLREGSAQKSSNFWISKKESTISTWAFLKHVLWDLLPAITYQSPQNQLSHSLQRVAMWVLVIERASWLLWSGLIHHVQFHRIVLDNGVYPLSICVD